MELPDWIAKGRDLHAKALEQMRESFSHKRRLTDAEHEAHIKAGDDWDDWKGDYCSDLLEFCIKLAERVG